jgi:general secretion pathway protein C
MRNGAHSMEMPRWAPPMVVALAAALCLWLGLRLLMTFLSAGEAPAAPQVVQPMFDAGAATATPTLAQWHLFGSAMPSQDARSAAAAPETTLDLRLTGILADHDPAAGIALIADGSGAQAAFKAGDVLPGGARLKSVHVDHVILVSNGRDETLRLPRERANEAPTRAANAPAQPGGLAAPVHIAGLETVDWQAVQRQAQGDPAALARQINVLPVIENGAIVGMRLGGAQSAMLSRIGLRPDDVVTAVNGISVKDVGRARQVIEAVRDADRVSVTVRRNGREETLDVSLK